MKRLSRRFLDSTPLPSLIPSLCLFLQQVHSQTSALAEDVGLLLLLRRICIRLLARVNAEKLPTATCEYCLGGGHD